MTVLGRAAGLLAQSSVGEFERIADSRDAFWAGASFGAIAFLIVVAASLLLRRRDLVAGVILAATTLLALRQVYGRSAAPDALVRAVVVLVACGVVAAIVRSRFGKGVAVEIAAAAILIPGAVALSNAFPAETPSWMRWSAFLGAFALAVLPGSFDAKHHEKGAPFGLFGATAIAVYYVVPDTELPLVLMGCAVPLMLLSVPTPIGRLGQGGAAAMSGVTTWVIVIGGRGRPGSVVAGLTAAGILAAEPIMRPFRQKVRLFHRRGGARIAWLRVLAVLLALQFAYGLYCAKVAGRPESAATAALLAIPPLAVIGLFAADLLAATARHHGNRGTHGRSRSTTSRTRRRHGTSARHRHRRRTGPS